MTSSIGDKIKSLRKKLRMTQEELGEKVGVTKATINKYETGVVVNLPRPKIEKLAEALQTTPAYLMGWEEGNVTVHGEHNNVVAHNAQEVHIGENLSEEEHELLRIYRSLSVKSRMELLTKAFDLEDAGK